jgi:hypothetical protein
VEDESIFHMIFEISYKNKFFSKNYSLLIIQLSKNENFKKFIINQTERLYTLYDDMNYVSPNANYNEFCENVKKTDERNSLGCFYANLFANGFIGEEVIVKFIDYLLGNIKSIMDVEGKSHEVEEMVDTIYSILTISKINICYETIELISKTNNKAYKSITSKSIFKCMDIMDIK